MWYQMTLGLFIGIYNFKLDMNYSEIGPCLELSKQAPPLVITRPLQTPGTANCPTIFI